MPESFSFQVTHTDGQARRGVLTTPHGVVHTPAFMPVGTRGAVKAVTHRDLEDAGAEIILGNTYHLLLRPGAALIARAGGLHRFIGWARPILTDSGGYQVFSLAAMRKVTEDGVTFRSPLDGALHTLTPEGAADIQAQLGSDIAMVLDELVGPAPETVTVTLSGPVPDPESVTVTVPDPVTLATARAAMERSIRWARRARTRQLQLREGPHAAPDVRITNPGQAQFGIIQGGTDAALRTESVQATVAIGFEGYAIGGLSVGEPVDVMYDVVAHTAPQLPADQPRYLMGTGMPDDLVECVARGIDMFDCVLPTRSGRTGQAFTAHGPLNMRNARFAEDQEPIEPNCPCPACTTFSRAYVHHLVKSGEILGAMLMTQHNLWFYQRMMQGLRDAIAAQALKSFASGFLTRYRGS